MFESIINQLGENKEWLFGGTSISLVILTLLSARKTASNKKSENNFSKFLIFLKSQKPVTYLLLIGAVALMFFSLQGIENSGNSIVSGHSSTNINANNSEVKIER